MRDGVALRAARGRHDIIFEDGDQGPALRALTPWLSWEEVDGLQTLPFGEFADFKVQAQSLTQYTAAINRVHRDLELRANIIHIDIRHKRRP